MKIAYIVNKFPSLSETFILNQLCGLIDLGHEITIFARSNSGQALVHPEFEKYRLAGRTLYRPGIPKAKFLARAKAAGMTVRNLLTAPVTFIRGIKGVVKNFNYDNYFFWSIFLDKDFDVILCHFGEQGKVGAYLKRNGIDGKLVSFFHGSDVHVLPRLLGRYCYQQLFECGDLFFSNTNFTKNKVVELGCDKDKINVLPVGLDLSKFVYKERHYEHGHKFKILSVGRLVEKKGYRYSIEAVAKVMSKREDVVYNIVGDGPLRNELFEQVSLLGLGDKIVFKGALDHNRIIELYHASDVFLLPSVTATNGDMEGQALVLQEAQACGLPVISTLHNGIPEGVIDGVSGFLVPEGDSNAIAEKLELLIDRPGRIKEMGKAGREFVEDRYGIKQLVRKLEASLIELTCD